MEKIITTQGTGMGLKETMRYVQQQVLHTILHGQQLIHHSIHEFKATMKDAGTTMNLMQLPINNFLKDPAQIQQEFEREATRLPITSSSSNASEQFCVNLNGKLVPVEEVLAMRMEENY